MNHQLQLDFDTKTVTLTGGYKPVRQFHQERTEWVNSPLTEELLKFFADKGLLEECDFDIDDKFVRDYEEHLWANYQKENQVWVGYEPYLTEKDVDEKREQMTDLWWNAWVRIATALQEMQETPNICNMRPEDYVSDLWSTYALNSSIHFERPLGYREFTHCFDGWLKFKNHFSYENIRIY